MKVLKKSWEYFGNNKKTVIICYLTSFVIVLLNMINPKITGTIFDEIFSDSSSASLFYVLFLFSAMIGVTVVKHIFAFLRSRFLEKSSMKFICRLRKDCMDKYFAMSFETFNKTKTGNLMTVLSNDPESIKNVFSSIIPIMTESVLSFVTASIILFSMSPKLAIACYATLPFIYIAVRKYATQVRPVYINIREQSARFANAAQENINGVRQVRAFAREDYEIKKIDAINRDVRKSNLDYVPVWSKNYWKMFSLTNLTYIITIGLGGILVCYEELTLGEMVAFTGYITYLMNPLNMIPTYITVFQTALVSGCKIMDLLEKEPKIKSPENSKPPTNWDINFKNVSLSYDGNIALKDINLKIPFGSKVGIVGATSSGKSSLINLIPRFYDPTSGEITVGGVNLKECNLSLIRNNISMVMQDVFLFSDTIRSNIQYCTENEATEKEIISAAKTACAHEFICETPDGYDTVVGERGVGLSGGQKQRISMARAFLKPAKILIMDDSTSALDNKTEKQILKNINKLDGEKTVIVIASRISSVRDSDIILFLEHGQIAEQGTHDELMAKGGRYAEVFNEQYSG